MSDKFIHITDLHFANNPPTSRIDDYNDTLLKKLEWVVNYSNKVKANGLLLGGDIWHTHQPNSELLLKFVDTLYKSNCNIYFIWGNHDIQGSNTGYIDKTNFGFFKRLDKFVYIGARRIEFAHTMLQGKDYSVKEECQLHWELPHAKEKRRCNLLLTHPMITKERSIVIDENYRQVNYEEITTNADVMLCGHYHGGFPVHKGKYKKHEFQLANPGSFGRVNLKEAKESSGPALTEITINGSEAKLSYVKIPTLAIKDIFDSAKQNKKKRDETKKDDFKNVLEKLSESNVMGDNFTSALQGVLDNPPKAIKKLVRKETITLCKQALREQSE